MASVVVARSAPKHVHKPSSTHFVSASAMTRKPSRDSTALKNSTFNTSNWKVGATLNLWLRMSALKLVSGLCMIAKRSYLCFAFTYSRRDATKLLSC